MAFEAGLAKAFAGLWPFGDVGETKMDLLGDDFIWACAASTFPSSLKFGAMADFRNHSPIALLTWFRTSAFLSACFFFAWAMEASRILSSSLFIFFRRSLDMLPSGGVFGIACPQ